MYFVSIRVEDNSLACGYSPEEDGIHPDTVAIVGFCRTKVEAIVLGHSEPVLEIARRLGKLLGMRSPSFRDADGVPFPCRN